MSNEFRQYRAPAGNGSLLAEPPLADYADAVPADARALDTCEVRLAGVPVCRLRISARADIARLTGRAVGPILMSGHQPEAFHPGVWIKNFALSRLAGQVGRTPLHMIADGDTAKIAGIRFPVLSDDPARVHTHSLAWDRFSGEVPWEERTIADEGLFASFPERARDFTEDWGYTPLLESLWPTQVAEHPAEAFTAMRRTLEARWGIDNAEVKSSELCELPVFGSLVRELVGSAAAFADIYNRAVREYRKSHGIRSKNHPVPDLAVTPDWVELPLWGWQEGDTLRGRLFAGSNGRLTVVPPGRNLPDANSAVYHIDSHPLKLRPRALLTTLFCRVLIADGFIHGIGGGKYDEVTDLLIRRWLRIEPPAFVVVSATIHLPLPHFPATPAQLHATRNDLRRLHWNPESAMDASDPTHAAMLAEKQRLLGATIPDRQDRRWNYRSLRRLGDGMRDAVRPQAAAMAGRESRQSLEVKANGRLRRRDYSFLLYPEEYLRRMLFDLAGG